MIDATTGLLEGVPFLRSPHFNQRPADTLISLLVIHAITVPAGVFGGDGIDRLFCPAEPVETPVSAHLLIRRDGAMTQYVSFHDRAWHAGVSSFGGRDGCNDYSIGIELEGTDHQPFESAQYDALAQVTTLITQVFPAITPNRIVGHSDIAPGRKTDPGPFFDWNKTRCLAP